MVVSAAAVDLTCVDSAEPRISRNFPVERSGSRGSCVIRVGDGGVVTSGSGARYETLGYEIR